MMLPGGRRVATVPLRENRDVAGARHAVAKAMDGLGTRALRKTRFVTAVSEIARNALVHGGGGTLDVYVFDRPSRVGVECRDEGPGIDAIDRVLEDGVSGTGSMGKGLGGAKRLADIFEIESSVGMGTVVRMVSAV